MVSRPELARVLFLVGLTSWGGPAVVAQIREALVTRRGWLSEAQLQASVAFCQLIPGPIAVQTAAHVGWRLHGGVGAAIALVAYVTPAFLLMLGLSAAYFHWGELPVAGMALAGMRAATVGIVVGSIRSLAPAALRDWRGVLVAAAATLAFLARLEVVLVLVGAGLAGVVLGSRRLRAPSTTSSEPQPANERDANAPRQIVRTLAAAAAVLATFAVVVLLSGQLAPVLPRLGLTMVKVNLLSFGGGYTAVALMYEEVVAGSGWLTSAQLVDGLALSQVTPGPVTVTATFIGYHLAGLPGAVLATLCVYLPSAVLLVVAAPWFARLQQVAVVASLVRGLLAAFVAMLFTVLWQVGKAAVVDPFTLALTLASVAAMHVRVNPAVIVAGAVVLALLVGR